MLKDMKPSTLIMLIVLVALIFVPAFFLKVEPIDDGAPGNDGIYTPPPPVNRPTLPPIRQGNQPKPPSDVVPPADGGAVD